ncbi:MAG: NADH-quinone oxidoreductase subunit D [Planctomycetia bacterium]|nr:NADH-quinone oxidoreductase subunit D [Planctomycetia bacterium]
METKTIEVPVRTDEMMLNMGPQHPSTHGVLRLVLRLDGEVVVDMDPVFGYLHRCAEKIGETLSPHQFLPYTDRLDYLAGMNMNLGYSLAVEKLCGIEVTPRTQAIRVLMAELGRICSHLVAAGCYVLDLGGFTQFMYAWREREKILGLFEAASGNRMTFSYIMPGGVRYGDLPDGWIEECEQFVKEFLAVVPDLHDSMTLNEIVVRRAAGIGVLSPDQAIAYGCSGPVLRGSGVAWDLRRHGDPIYTKMYDDYRFEIIASVNGSYPKDMEYPPIPPRTVVGDSWHRFYVRMLETVQSAMIVRQAIEKYKASAPEVSEPMKIMTKLPVGDSYVETEAPKGQMGFYVVGNGTNVPQRCRIRSSSFCNLSVLREICRGCMVGDVPSILGSIDIVLGEIDR